MAKKDYSKWDRNELIKEIEQLRKRKKYGLVWEDKPENVVEQCKKELPVLEEVKSKEIFTDPDKPVNLLIEGDNYHALSVLNYTHKGKIDVIYIDPPYNRGGDFIYNDKIVDKQDSYRHSKWASFMYKRLELARELLSKRGIIFISIDENEFAQLKIICDELFTDNLCGIFSWQKKYGGGNDSGKIATEHEYILAYSKYNTGEDWFEPHDEKYLKRYKEEDNIGRYFWDTLERPGLKNPIKVKIQYEGKEYSLKTFRSQARIDEEIKNGEVRIVKYDNGKIGFQFKQRLREGKKPRSLLRDAIQEEGDLAWAFQKIGSNASAKAEMRDIFGGDVFNNPKPTTLIKYLISLAINTDSIVLDFFAGSGTTGQAVLDYANKNNKNRFILCTNNENSIAENITYKRFKILTKGNDKVNKILLNLKYLKTSFIPADQTDKNKIALTEKATEMLCIKEDTFEEVKKTKQYRIFRNKNRFTGIVFDHQAIDKFKKEIIKINGKFSLYIFSLGDDTFDEEFEDMKKKVKLSPIPEAILRVYRRIFK